MDTIASIKTAGILHRHQQRRFEQQQTNLYCLTIPADTLDHTWVASKLRVGVEVCPPQQMGLLLYGVII